MFLKMKKKIRFFSLVAFFTSISIYGCAQPGNLDKSFGNEGLVLTSFGSMDAKINSISIQNDLKIVAGGYSTSNNHLTFTLVRYDTNGLLDGSFGNNGIVITDIGGGNNSIRSINIQPDGKIIAAGYAPAVSNYGFALAR